MKKGVLFIVSVMITVVVSDSCNLADEQNTRVDVCGFVEKPTLKHRFPEGKPVYGVQRIGQEIYVIRDSTPHIEVYDKDTHQPTRNISLGGLKGPYNLAQSRHNSHEASLFVTDWFNAVDLTAVKIPSGTLAQWSFNENGTVSLAGSDLYIGANILLTVRTLHKVKEFTPDGKLINEFTLQDIPTPHHCIKVAPDRYAVCHGYGDDEKHQVCLVDGKGETIKCYGGKIGSEAGQLNIPSRLDWNEKCILVADTGNKRVVLLDQNLDYVRNLIDRNLDGPYRLFLDEKQSLLYVADNTVDPTGTAFSGRLKVFSI